MKQEQKDKLLKYLCMALPYSVIVEDRNGTHVLSIGNTEFADLIQNGKCNIKPYLRPMLSMTEEEYKEMNELIGWYANIDYLTSIKDLQIWADPQAESTIWFGEVVRVQEWLLAKHFNFMELDEDSFIEVTEKNNPYKD